VLANRKKKTRKSDRGAMVDAASGAISAGEIATAAPADILGHDTAGASRDKRMIDDPSERRRRLRQAVLRHSPDPSEPL
jgi:hypothetical protein